MFCPNCRCEYRDGVKICLECNTELVTELEPVDSEKKQSIFLKHFRSNSNAKFYYLNGVLGFIWSPLLFLFITITATHSQRLPPDWREQSKVNTKLLFIILFFCGMTIITNIVGVVAFIRKNKSINGFGIKLLKFVLSNLIIFVLFFVIVTLLGLIILRII